MKIVFMGTPNFAVPSLNALISSQHTVVGVVTQPDKRGDRNKVLISPVKEIAINNNIPVFQFDRISMQGEDFLSMLGADIFVTCAYGQILSQSLINIPRFGIINVHASLLPKYRGAAPIQWSIINGDVKTGVTIMQTEAGLDCGDILHVEELVIEKEETAGLLFDRLSHLGAKALLIALKQIETGMVKPISQDSSMATSVKMLKKLDGKIDFSKTATEVASLVRGVNPWPGAFCFYLGEQLKFWSGQVEIVRDRRLYAFGEVIEAGVKEGLLIACSSGSAYRVGVMQALNGKRMFSTEYMKGHIIAVGDVFTSAQ